MTAVALLLALVCQPIDRLVADLGHPHWLVRERSTRAIRALDRNPEVRSAVDRGAASDDPEIRLRCRHIRAFRPLGEFRIGQVVWHRSGYDGVYTIIRVRESGRERYDVRHSSPTLTIDYESVSGADLIPVWFPWSDD